MTTPITSNSSSAAGQSNQTGASSSGQISGLNPGASLGQDAFMQLLVAQMTHQDPLAPADGTQMASQLAQFSQLEQLTNINTTLSGQSTASSGLTTAVNNSAALGLIGKTVTAQTSQIAVGPGATSSVTTTISGTGGDLVIKILDANGNTVETKDIGQVGAGSQTVQLAGLTTGLPAGVYTTQFSLTDAAGSTTNPVSTITAKVDGVSFGTSGATVTSGPLSIPIGSIASVTSN